MGPNPRGLIGQLPTFLHSQFIFKPPIPTRSFAGETVIVTGSNTGLGLEAARHIARLDATLLILAVRSTSKGEAARASILASHPESKTRIEVWPLDMASYESVQAFAARCERDLDRLDAVLENAGVGTRTFSTAEDNELTLTVNVVSTFLLALLLLPRLRQTATQHNTVPRLSIVASEVHFFTDFREWESPRGVFAELNDPKTADMGDRYNVSKMMEVLAVRALAPRMRIASASASSPGKAHPLVILDSVNPGLCHSELGREFKGIGGAFFALAKFLLARTTEAGGRCLVAALTVEEAHGEYVSDAKVWPVAPMVRGEYGGAMQEKVWAELAAKLEAIRPGVLANI